jgi:hypothetical protein
VPYTRKKMKACVHAIARALPVLLADLNIQTYHCSIFKAATAADMFLSNYFIVLGTMIYFQQLIRLELNCFYGNSMSRRGSAI